MITMAGGEVAPSAYARVDLAVYGSWLKTCLNWWIKPYGGGQNRPGTQHCAITKTTGDRVRLIPFQYTASQGYVIELGDKYMRFYKNGSPLNIPVTVDDAARESIGTGNGSATSFHLKISGTNVAPIGDVNVYVATVLQRQADLVNLLTSPDDFTDAAWTKNVRTSVAHHNAGPGNIYDTITWT